jgi:hypothetical protein
MEAVVAVAAMMVEVEGIVARVCSSIAALLSWSWYMVMYVIGKRLWILRLKIVSMKMTERPFQTSQLPFLTFYY